jgi:hypothetical protein
MIRLRLLQHQHPNRIIETQRRRQVNFIKKFAKGNNLYSSSDRRGLVLNLLVMFRDIGIYIYISNVAIEERRECIHLRIHYKTKLKILPVLTRKPYTKVGVLRASHKIFNSEVRICWNDASKFSSISSSQLTFCCVSADINSAIVGRMPESLPTILPC